MTNQATTPGEFLDNYAKINMIPQLQRVSGVGDVMSFGADYSMRIGSSLR